MKKVLYMCVAILCLHLVACEQKTNEQVPDGGVTFENPTYAQFSIAFEGGSIGPKNAPAISKVDEPHTETDAGSAAEYGITKVDVVFVATEDIEVTVDKVPTQIVKGNICYVRNFGASDLTPQNPGPGLNSSVEYTTPVFQVAEGTFEVYVVVNSPVTWVINQPFDKKRVQSVDNIDNITSGIAKAQNFLMTNVFVGDEAKDNANTLFTLEKRREDNPNVINVAIERVVAKFTYDNGSKKGSQQVEIKSKETGKAFEGVTASLTGMKMFNQTKETYFFKQFSSDNVYVTDPKHGDKSQEDKTSFLVNQLNQLTSVAEDFDKVYYFLENTMVSTEQKFGNTTGVVFKAQYDITEPSKVFTEVGLFDIQSTEGTTIDADTSSEEFKNKLETAFVATETDYKGIMENGSGAVVFKNEYTSKATCFTYNGHLFATPIEVAYYYTINNDADCANGVIPEAKLADIATLAKEIKDATTSEETAINYSREHKNDNKIGIFFNAMGYYTIALSNQGSGNYGFDRTDGNMMPMEYCMVRNHWYQMVVSSLNGFGKAIPDIDPDVPVESMDASANVIIKVMPWKVVREEVEL